MLMRLSLRLRSWACIFGSLSVTLPVVMYHHDCTDFILCMGVFDFVLFCFDDTGVDFFNEISTAYALLHEFCTKTSCPVMNAGPKYANFFCPVLMRCCCLLRRLVNRRVYFFLFLS